MNWYLVRLTKTEGEANKVVEAGWMLAETDEELVKYARIMKMGIDIEYLGKADMQAFTPTILH